MTLKEGENSRLRFIETVHEQFVTELKPPWTDYFQVVSNRLIAPLKRTENI